MKISVLGAGYVGLVTGAVFASRGHTVILADIDGTKVATINLGKAPFFEPKLAPLVQQGVVAQKLRATTDLQLAIADSDVTFVAVGTPNANRTIDVKYIRNACQAIGTVLKNKPAYHTVVIKSTVTPDVFDDCITPTLQETSGKNVGEFGLCMNPEFLRQGTAVDDFINQDRIVIGQYDIRSGQALQELYQDFRCPIIVTSIGAASIAKYASNLYFAMLISFSNEIANVCEIIRDVHVEDVLKTLVYDKRIVGKIGDLTSAPAMISYLRSGCGYGGSCFPKDVEAFINFAQMQRVIPHIGRAVATINADRAKQIVTRLSQTLGSLQDKTVTVLGLSFKPDTDDMRQSPSLAIVQQLVADGARVVVYDPQAMQTAALWFKDLNITYAASTIEALRNSDACVVVTLWKEFTALSPGIFLQHMRNAVVFDARHAYDWELFGKHLRYLCPGYQKS